MCYFALQGSDPFTGTTGTIDHVSDPVGMAVADDGAGNAIVYATNEFPVVTRSSLFADYVDSLTRVIGDHHIWHLWHKVEDESEDESQ